MTKQLNDFKFSHVMEVLATEKPPLLAIPPNTSIRSALNSMAQLNILNVCVSSRSFKDKVASVVSTYDILSFLVKNPQADLDAKTIEDCMTLDMEDESYRIWERDLMDTLKETLRVFSTGIHRAIITDALEKHPPFILTQTDIVRFINKVLDTLDVKRLDLDASLESLGLVRNSVVSMTPSESALTGYNRMKNNKILAIPVIESNGEFLHALSNSHLRSTELVNLDLFKGPVMNLLAKYPKPMTTSASISLREALSLVVNNHLHRLWIVKDNNKLQGVVTLSDLIAKIAHIK